MTTTHSITYKFILEYNNKINGSNKIKKNLAGKIQALLVILNVASYAVRVNEIHSSYRNWQLEDPL